MSRTDKIFLAFMLICFPAFAEVDVLPSVSTAQDTAVLNENLRQLDARIRTLAGQTTPIVSLTTGVSGVLPIVNGGTGETTAQAALNSFTLASSSTNEYVLTKDTASGNAMFKAIPVQTQYFKLVSTTTWDTTTTSGNITIDVNKNYMAIVQIDNVSTGSPTTLSLNCGSQTTAMTGTGWYSYYGVITIHKLTHYSRNNHDLQLLSVKGFNLDSSEAPDGTSSDVAIRSNNAGNAAFTITSTRDMSGVVKLYEIAQ